MYPSPTSLYQPQVPQQPSQLIPQTSNQNIHPSPPPPSIPTSSSTYPYPQNNYNSNSTLPGHPVQQAMPYLTASATNQQNVPLSVSIIRKFYFN